MEKRDSKMNFKEIQNLMNDFKKSELMYLELETKEFKLKLSKQKDNNITIENNQKSIEPIVSNNEPVIITNEPKVGKEIKSPLVGTFYNASSPDDEPYVKEGDYVNVGDVVCIVEAMKIMNEITSDVSGKILKVMKENGSAIGFDDVLFVVDENDTK